MEVEAHNQQQTSKKQKPNQTEAKMTAPEYDMDVFDKLTLDTFLKQPSDWLNRLLRERERCEVLLWKNPEYRAQTKKAPKERMVWELMKNHPDLPLAVETFARKESKHKPKEELKPKNKKMTRLERELMWTMNK